MSQPAPSPLAVELALAVALNDAAIAEGIEPVRLVRAVRRLARAGLLGQALANARHDGGNHARDRRSR